MKKLRYIWGLAVSTLALPLVLIYGVLVLVQTLILATILIPYCLGCVLKKFILVMHGTIGPTARENENLQSPLTKFNKIILSQEIDL